MNLDFLLTEKIIQLSFQYAWLDALGLFLADYAVYVFVFLVFLLFFWNFKVTLLAVFTGFFARYFLVTIFRFFIERQRPFFFFENLLAQIKETNSFPSGHTVFYFALSTIVYLYNKKIGMVFLALSFLMSFARIFVGYHWLGDILAGIFLGVLFALLIKHLLGKKIRQRS